MRKLSFFLVVLVLMTTILTSCEKEVICECEKPEATEVTGITLDKSTLTLEIGGWQILTATVLPANATDKSVVWASSNPIVATIVDGIVTALTVGTTTIIAKAGTHTTTCKVTVNPPSLAGTIWKGNDSEGTQCTLKFTNATNCIMSRVGSGDKFGTYSALSYPIISVNLTGEHSLSGTIINNTVTLINTYGTYSVTLTKQ